MKRTFIEWAPKPETLALVKKADGVLREYAAAGYRVTLRQLYYRFVAEHRLPNNFRSYKNFGTTIANARLAGLLDWDVIEDRGRRPCLIADWSTPKEFLDDEIGYFRLPRWEGQPNYVEIWVEKDALAGVLQPVANRHHVPLCVNKGYSSQSAMFESANRFRRALRQHEKSFLLYLGDHDPSGEDMVRDIRDRLKLFGATPVVEKLALTMEQIEEHEPPPNPAKTSDSRAEKYIEIHGSSSWELDALRPETLVELLDGRIAELVDTEILEKVVRRERRYSDKLTEAVEAIEWDDEP